MSETSPVIENIDFGRIFNAAPDLYLLMLPSLILVGASEAYLKATMIQRKSIVGKHLFEVFPDNPNDPSANGSQLLRASLEKVLITKAPDIMAIQKYDIRKPNSEEFEERHWSPINTPVFGASGEIQYILHRVEDVTDYVKLKMDRVEEFKANEELRTRKDQLEKMRQSQRMEAMGQLAGGVAHDFNNILAAIMITCENSMADSELSNVIRGDLNQIHRSCERAAGLTRQLLAFSRKQILQPKVLNLNTALAELPHLLSRLVSENIELSISLGDDLGNTLLDQGQLEQIVLNLVVNSRDALPNGGSITIETANAVLDKALAAGPLQVNPGRYVMLAVRDNGIGMDGPTQARIFEPFFTTKGAGKGTGLGLATVYGIVQQNRGSIWVYSEPGRGSVFKIYFPLVNEPVENVFVPASRNEEIRGNETILVVEDQDDLRDAICGTLINAGYSVLAAGSGLEALECLARNPNIVDLILTDVVMPEMGGQDLAKRLVQRGDHTKILYLSGYTEDVLANHGVSGEHPQFLEKPFNRKALLSKIRSILS